ncbi:serine hydrolase, partial [Planktotalea sp.]|uniref:serine hydrolase n=1 Tax=Planktotalea sp. TaxID=2029877 RepID=UPI0032984A43
MPDTARPSHTFTRGNVSLENWRLAPYSSWAFQNVQEIVPSVFIQGNARKETSQLDLAQLVDLTVDGIEEAPVSLPEFLEQTHTDAFVVMKQGAVVAEWHAKSCDPHKPHIIFSISKSILGLLTGILVDKGSLGADDPVVQHIPEMAGSAYGDATLRNLL